MKNFKIFNKNEEFVFFHEKGATPWEFEAIWRGRLYKMLHLLIKTFYTGIFVYSAFYIFKNF